MSDHEFEAYLGLLTRFLRLSGPQRDEIRRELRAHLEEALDDYLARGLTHREAVLRALEDFGDAAELAARFRAIGRRRRWIMRGTATAAGIGIVAVTASFFAASPNIPARAGFEPARLTQSSGTPAGHTSKAGKHDDDANAAVEAALQKPMPEVAFEETPFAEVVDYLAQQHSLNVVVRWSILDEMGISRDRPVTLRLRNVTTAQVLWIVLSDAGHNTAELGYQVKDGVLFISTEESLKRDVLTRVYDVRDLVTAGLNWEETKARLGSEKNPFAASSPTPPPAAPFSRETTPAPPGPVGGTSVTDAASKPSVSRPEQELVELIQNTVLPDDWRVNGGTGSATVYNGILVVRQHPAGHQGVEELLLMLRDAGANGPGDDGMAAR